MLFAATSSKEVNTQMLKWQIRYLKAALGVGALVALLVGSGAGMRW